MKVGHKKIETIAKCFLSKNCPLKIFLELFPEDGEYRMDNIKARLIVMNDDELQKLYNKLMYHTRYKANKEVKKMVKPKTRI